jgi:hypothetical protein
MNEDGEERFKRIAEIYSSGVRSLGAANATGALAAGAAYQAFEKRPDVQSSIKEIIVMFFAGIIAFTVSQIAIHLAQIYMERYFRQSTEPADWEGTIFGNKRPDENYLRMVSHDFVVLGFAMIASLVLFLFGLGLIGKLLLIL